MSKVTHVILTGGVGSRLWPLSRKSRPKQYLAIFGGKSLFELTAERNNAFANNLIVVGSRDNCHLSKEILDACHTNYLDVVEAVPRNTAAAIAFAAFASEPDDILIVTPSDHIIEGEEAYKQAISEAVEKASQGYIVTFGVHPTKPETGYGYIEHKDDEVISFREKPNQVTAQEFIDRGNFLWNSGMFCFKASVLLDELKAYQPEVYEKSLAVWNASPDGKLDEALSLQIPSISIDYAVMERSKKIRVVPAIFKWSDLGSFDSVYEYLSKMGHKVDEFGNMVIGTDNYTAFLGLENTIFVHTPNANLILHKDHSQEVKNIYSQLEKQKSVLID